MNTREDAVWVADTITRQHLEIERLNVACASYVAQSVRDGLEIERLRAAMTGARTAIVAASIASCTCLTKTPDASHHAADCRYAKLAFALDCLDAND